MKQLKGHARDLTWVSLPTPGCLRRPTEARLERPEMETLARRGSADAGRRVPTRDHLGYMEPQVHPCLLPICAEVCLPHTPRAPSPGSQSAGAADGVKGRIPEAPGQLLG